MYRLNRIMPEKFHETKITVSLEKIACKRVQFKLSRQISIFVCTLKTECYEQGRIFIGSVTVLQRV
jgi:DNA-directed RNA polymerase subunit E'/Rpb7